MCNVTNLLNFILANTKTSKTVNGITTNYYLDGSTILAEERIAPLSQIEFIYYIYDITGVAGLIHTQGSTSTIYFYIKNALGDVVAITNSYGSLEGAVSRSNICEAAFSVH